MAKLSNNFIETFLGAFVVVTAAYFVYFAYTANQDGRSLKGYTISAKFQRIDGLHVGNDVKISGVKIGSVLTLTIDPKSYQAKTTLFINDNIKLPVDSNAAIVSEGLLGGKYVSIEPGTESELLEDKGIIEQTQSSVNFETLLNKFLFSKSEETDSQKKN